MQLSVQDRIETMQLLTDGQDHLLEQSLAPGSRALRDRAVSRWLAFCHVLAVDPIIRSIDDSLSLRWFVYFLGSAWVNIRKSSHDDNRGLSHKYIAGLLSSVRQWHLDKGYTNPLDFDKITSKVLIGLRRITGDTYKPPLPVSQVALQFVITTLRKRKTTRDTVIAATMIVMFAFLLRISEVAQTATKRGTKAAFLRHGDVVFSDNKGEVAVGIELRDTKSDPFNLIARSLPHIDKGDVYDVMHRIMCDNVAIAQARNYSDQQLAEMPFLNFNGVPLEREDVSQTLREILSQPDAPDGLPDPSRYSSHSLRKGGATELLRLQIDIPTIKWLGRWKSMAWLLYTAVSEDSVNRVARVMANAIKF